jgi:predicted ATPase
MDEPEAALSTQGRLAALTRMHDLAQQGSQLLVATHSPILLAVPGARILEIATTAVSARSATTTPCPCTALAGSCRTPHAPCAPCSSTGGRD